MQRGELWRSGPPTLSSRGTREKAPNPQITRSQDLRQKPSDTFLRHLTYLPSHHHPIPACPTREVAPPPPPTRGRSPPPARTREVARRLPPAHARSLAASRPHTRGRSPPPARTRAVAPRLPPAHARSLPASRPHTRGRSPPPPSSSPIHHIAHQPTYRLKNVSDGFLRRFLGRSRVI